MTPDLLVWIPKGEGVGTVDDQRPLQLPTTTKRLFGAVLLAGVGKAMEDALSPHQAARHRGDCGPNVRKVYAHLAGGDRPGRALVAEPRLWAGVLGEAAGPALRLCKRVDAEAS